ncbi:MAG: metallophosphoesterase [Myxococcota bacterium]|nr:metallophosphoesterase [Myxococcota bacterium]
MRIAHVTDIHVQRAPKLSELFGKRALGAANLYLAGRRSHFTAAAQSALVDAVLAQKPDLLACTGDLTALASEAEFLAARELLGPMFEAQPSVLIPGNHDTYVAQVQAERWIERHFGEWTGSGPWPRLHLHGDLAFIGVDVCRHRPILSTGEVDPEQLERLDQLLASPQLDGRFVFLMVHYPLRGRRGEPYGPDTRNIKNAAALEAVLLRHAHRVGAILHGHEHHGFRTALPNPEGPDIDILNPGAGGYAFLPDKGRTAHFCVYEVQDGALTGVERFAFDGQAFEPEAGGAWATGG